ncbi:MAG: hypothetical protein WBV55_13975 [Candidatus Sulfotelmatobacter sp.]
MIDSDFSTAKNIKYPQWQRELEAAVSEHDPQMLRVRVDSAEAAIFLRLQMLANDVQGKPEREALEEAIRILRTLQKDKLGYPEWKKK